MSSSERGKRFRYLNPNQVPVDPSTVRHSLREEPTQLTTAQLLQELVEQRKDETPVAPRPTSQTPFLQNLHTIYSCE
jgi:hypothetical protein